MAGAPVFVEGQVIASGEAQTKIARGTLKPVAWSPVVVAVGPAAELRGRPPARARRQPVDRAHAAGDRHVGAVRQGARLPAEEDRVRPAHQARGVQPGLRGVRQAGVRPVQAGAHQPRLLHLGPVGGGGRVLRRHRQAGGPHREGRDRLGRAQAGARHRALDRPLRRHHAVHRRPDAPRGPGLRVGGGDGGGHAARLQPQPRQPAASWWRSTRPRARSTRTTRSSRSTPSTTRRPSATARRRSRSSWPTRSTPRPPGGAGSARPT